jgi:hypothetical protein
MVNNPCKADISGITRYDYRRKLIIKLYPPGEAAEKLDPLIFTSAIFKFKLKFRAVPSGQAILNLSYPNTE